MINIKEINEKTTWEQYGICSLGWLVKSLEQCVDTCKLNHIDPNDVPITILNKDDNINYLLDGISYGFGLIKPARVGLTFCKDTEIDYH